MSFFKICKFDIIASYKKDSGGNMAITFAVAMLMVLVAVGAAVDFTMAQSSRVKMQNPQIRLYWRLQNPAKLRRPPYSGSRKTW